MNIYVSKQYYNNFIFFYNYNQDFFTHKLSINKFVDVSDDELFRLALITNPFNSENINVLGIKPSQAIQASLSRILNTSINCEVDEKGILKTRKKIDDTDTIYLGFSGGFDSLAAAAILPYEYKKVSIDYGGNFSREKDFFMSFNTNLVTWDLRNRRTNSLERFDERKNWRFMLTPLTLFRENSNNIIIATGSILESSIYWCTDSNMKELEQYSDSGFGVGVSVVNPIAGLTEFGTTLIVSKEYDDITVEKSLKSLAAPDSFKFHRKKCLLSAVNSDSSIEKIKKPKQKYKFGTGFTDDFITLYFCWKYGLEWVLSFYAENISEKLDIPDMSFVEKLNEHNLLYLDKSFRKEVIKNIKHYNIDSYNENDYKNLDIIKNGIVSKKWVSVS